MCRFKRPTMLALSFLLVLTVQAAGAQSDGYPSPRYLSIQLDNDQLAGKDANYTAGLRLLWMSDAIPSAERNPWLNWLPFVRQPGAQRAVSLSLGQHIYTPLYLSVSRLIEEDRPYAGVLTMNLGIHSRTETAQDFMGLTLGIVGPASGAETMQGFIHDLFGQVDPSGWSHQLGNEFLMAWMYEHKWKTLRQGTSEGMGFDVIPHLGMALGNLHTYAGGGAQVRWGWRLPRDFGGFITRPGGFRNPGFRERGRNSFYIYGGINGMAVLRNLLLDGNTIRQSHRVDKYPLTADVFLGLSWRIQRVQLFLEYVYWTKRFETETKSHMFGTLSLVYSF
jgi:hypothetical protein